MPLPLPVRNLEWWFDTTPYSTEHLICCYYPLLDLVLNVINRPVTDGPPDSFLLVQSAVLLFPLSTSRPTTMAGTALEVFFFFLARTQVPV